MIKFLLNIPFIKKKIVKELFNIAYIDQDQHAITEYKFTDSKGNKYFRYLEDKLMPPKRYEQMQLRLLEIESRIGRETLLEFSKALKKFAEAKDFIKVATLIGQLEERLELLYDPELLMRFLSGMYIREDQIKTAYVWNPKLEEEKFQQLMEDNEPGGKLSFFFQQCSLSKHVSFLNMSDGDSEKLMSEPVIQNQLKQSRLFNRMVTEISNTISRQKSYNG